MPLCPPTQMVDLYRDPTGEMAVSSSVRKESLASLSYHTKERGEVVGGGEIEYLRRRVTELEIELSQLNTEQDHHTLSAESS